MISDIEELSNLVNSFEDNTEDNVLIEENKKLTKFLLKKGIKIREHKWTELEAS